MEEEEKQSTFDRIMRALGKPNAALRAGVGALQDDVTDLEAAKRAVSQAWDDPSTAPSGFEIGEKAGLSDDNVLGKTIIATGAEFLDPQDLLPIGAMYGGLKAGRKLWNPQAMRSVPPEDFHKAIKDAEKANPNIKPFVTDYEPWDLINFKTMLTPDAKSGVVIKPDGEIANVFSSVPGRGSDLVDRAKLEGGNKLDHFDQPRLNELYGEKGFKETDRLQFSDEFAPKDWDYEKLGRPDVVMRELPEETKFDKIKRIIKRNF